MTKRAVLYARVCVDDRQSLVEQLATCREHTQELGWNIEEELAEQGAGSGSANLPQLNCILELAQAGAFDVLVVRELSRISRDLTRLFAITEELKKANIQVKFVRNHSSDKGG